ncbi:MAG: DnaJ C-terminal domain-containing protein [Gemmataceae bacterium]
MAQDLYETLGLAKNATTADIEKAYRKLARQYHPDRNPGDKSAEAKFKEVSAAYQILSDKQKREEYDQYGQVGGHGSPGPGGQQFHFGGGGGGANFDMGDAQRIFEQFFGGGGGGGFGGMGSGSPFGQQQQRRGRAKPASQEAEITIPFVTAATGGSLPLRINQNEVTVKIPPGMEDGKVLRLGGQGSGGADLLLRVHVQPHEHFRIENGNLTLNVPISLSEAVLGATIDVPLLDGGSAAVKIPAGSSTGNKLRLKAKGIKGGDFYVRLEVMVPKHINERAKELIQEFAKLHPDHPRHEPFWQR